MVTLTGGGAYTYVRTHGRGTCALHLSLRAGAGAGLGSLVPSPTLGRWLPAYSKLGQHYVSGPRSGTAM